MRIGVISDTHGYFDPRLEKLFSGVDAIWHAGDVGRMGVLLELERIAPVTAVRGNNDWDLPLQEIEVVEAGGLRFLLRHIVDPERPGEPVRTGISRGEIQGVIFGHTHRPYWNRRHGILFLNPGYGGRPKLHQPRTVALLHVDGAGCQVEHLPLDDWR